MGRKKKKKNKQKKKKRIRIEKKKKKKNKRMIHLDDSSRKIPKQSSCDTLSTVCASSRCLMLRGAREPICLPLSLSVVPVILLARCRCAVLLVLDFRRMA